MTKYRLVERTTTDVDGKQHTVYVIQLKTGWLWRWADRGSINPHYDKVRFTDVNEGIQRVKELSHVPARKERVVYPQPEQFSDQFDY